MSSSFFGEPSSGNGRSGSSRKGKKSNSDKPKQPQRGLGVAQLEQIRLSNEMSSCYMPNLHSPSYTSLNQDVRAELVFSSSSSSYSSPSSFGVNPNMMMGLGDMEVTTSRYGESQSSGTSRIGWNYDNSILKPQQPSQFGLTRQFLTPPMENASRKMIMNAGLESMGSGSQYSNSSDEKELDLDLKL